MNVAYNMDCMEAMKEMKDNQFDLAIVDPPYGIGRANNKKTIGKNKSRVNSYIKRTDYNNKKWDSASPNNGYFNELTRVSMNQIIWGANHFIEEINKNSSCWIIWDKVCQIETYASGEMAFTSFDKPMKIVKLKHSGFRRGQNIGEESKVIYNVPFSGAMDIHPTQKPVKLYEWLLKNYAKEGDTILDTHLGSGSSRIAAYNLGFDFTGYELDKDYFEAQEKRFKNHISQKRIFDTPKQIAIQEAMNFE